MKSTIIPLAIAPGSEEASQEHGQLRVQLEEANRQLGDLLAHWRRKARHLAAVNGIAHTLVSAADADAMLAGVAHQVRHSLSATVASVALAEIQGQETVYRTCTCSDDRITWHRRPASGQDIASRVIGTGQPIRRNDGCCPEDVHTSLLGVVPLPLDAILCVPLLASTQVIGAIEVIYASGPEALATGRPARFGRQDQVLLEEMGALVALAVQNAALQTMLRQKAAMEAFQQTVITLAHHVNNPLQGLVGAADLLKQRLEDAGGHDEPCLGGETTGEMLDLILAKSEEISAVLRLLQQVSLPQRTVYAGSEKMLDIEEQLRLHLGVPD